MDQEYLLVPVGRQSIRPSGPGCGIHGQCEVNCQSENTYSVESDVG